MGEKERDEIFLFDTLYTTNHLRMLKILLPALPPQTQGKIAVYIKCKELQYTLDFTKKAEHFSDKQDIDIQCLQQKLAPYCSQKEKDFLKKILDMQGMMEKYKEIMQLMPILEGMSGKDGDLSGMNPDELLKNMLSEEQQAMFSMFQGGLFNE